MLLRPSLLALVAPVLIAVPLSEFWQLTAHLRYREASPDPAATMEAVVYHQHGSAQDVLSVERIARPAMPPARGLIVIKVEAAALNPVDFKMRRTEQPGLLIPKPNVAGVDVAGRVVSVGAGVGRFVVGDAVYGMLPIVGSRWGALSEYTVGHASAFAKAPRGIPLESSAGLPLVGLTVLQVADQAGFTAETAVGLKAGTHRAGQSALVQAASGGVGTFAVQYFRHVLGMGSVTGVCGAQGAARVRELGATATIDYRTERFEDVARDVDLVIDPVAWGNMERTLAGSVLKPAGACKHARD